VVLAAVVLAAVVLAAVVLAEVTRDLQGKPPSLFR
jgi:hypothetical protein